MRPSAAIALCLACFFAGILLDRLYVIFMLRRVKDDVHDAIRQVERATRDSASAGAARAAQVRKSGRN